MSRHGRTRLARAATRARAAARPPAPTLRYEVVLLDALGTLLDLAPPAPQLVGALAARGVDVSADAARRAMVAEMTYYRAHCDAAGTLPALGDLHDRCAGIVRDELGDAVAELPFAEVRAAMLEAFSFPPYPEVAGVLAALREAGVRCVVVSNWDISLHDALRAGGLERYLDGAVTSAEMGVAKPDPALLRCALAGKDVPLGRVLMVGDTAADVLAARAAGVDVVLVDRHGLARQEPWIAGPPAATVMPDLTALVELVAPYPPEQR